MKINFKNYPTSKLTYRSTLVFIFIIFCNLSCQKTEHDFTVPLLGSQRVISRTESDDFNFSQLEIQDKLKYVIAKLTARNLNNQAFLNFLLSYLNQRNESELFYLSIRNQQINSGYTFEGYLKDQINQDDSVEKEWEALLSNAAQILPSLVFSIPYWTQSVLSENGGIPNLTSEDLSIWPCMSKNIYSIQSLPTWFGYRNRDVFSHGMHSRPVFDHIPIQVKESERYVLVSTVNAKTWYGRGIDDLFLNTTVPSLMEMLTSDYITNEGHILTGYSQDFRLLDILSIQIYINKYITPDSGEPQSFPACEKICDRDCVEEKNYIDGFKFTNGAVYAAVNNQPGGENLITLVMQFLTAQMCGNLSVPETCAANSWFRTITAETSKAFGQVTVILHENEIATNIPESAFIIYMKKLAPWLKHYRIVYLVPQCVNVTNLLDGNKLFFLDQGGTPEWNGNIYGSNMLVSVHEHDEIVTQQATVITEQRAVTTKVSLNIVSPGDTYKGNYEYSNTVTRTTSNTLNFIAEKDVRLGDFGLHYCNKSYLACPSSPEGAPNTGSVVIYVAFE